MHVEIGTHLTKYMQMRDSYVPGFRGGEEKEHRVGDTMWRAWIKTTLIQKRNRLTDIENRLVVAKEGRERNGLGVWAR